MDFVNIGMKIMAIFATCDTFLTNQYGKLKLHYEGDNPFV